MSEIIINSQPRPFSQERNISVINEILTVEEMLVRSGCDLSLLSLLHVHINDEYVPREEWAVRKPFDGDIVSIGVVPQGGGSGGKNPLRTVLTIAVMVGATMFGGPAGASLYQGFFAGGVGTEFGYGVATALGKLAFTAVGMLAVNAIAPPPTPDLQNISGISDNAAASQTYNISGGRNRALQFGVIPRVYGVNKMVPPLAALPYTEIINNEQYVRLLLCWGIGPLSISDIKIAGTPIGLFHDVEVEHHNGFDGEPDIALYQNDVYEEGVGVAVTKADTSGMKSIFDNSLFVRRKVFRTYLLKSTSGYLAYLTASTISTDANSTKIQVFVSNDNGASWSERLNKTIASKSYGTKIQATEQLSTVYFYVGAYLDSVVSSSDNGVTWSLTARDMSEYPSAGSFGTSNTTKLFWMHYDNHLLSSDLDGTNFTKLGLLDSSLSSYWTIIFGTYILGSTILVGVTTRDKTSHDYIANRFFKSTDSGTTFSEIGSGYPIVVAPWSNPDLATNSVEISGKMYFIIQDNTLVTFDGTTLTFTTIALKYNSLTDSPLALTNNGSVLYVVGKYAVYLSNDLGVTWAIHTRLIGQISAGSTYIRAIYATNITVSYPSDGKPVIGQYGTGYNVRASQGAVDEFSVDVVFPQGLVKFSATDGSHSSRTVEYTVEWSDDGGVTWSAGLSDVAVMVRNVPINIPLPYVDLWSGYGKQDVKAVWVGMDITDGTLVTFDQTTAANPSEKHLGYHPIALVQGEYDPVYSGSGRRRIIGYTLVKYNLTDIRGTIPGAVSDAEFKPTIIGDLVSVASGNLAQTHTATAKDQTVLRYTHRKVFRDGAKSVLVRVNRLTNDSTSDRVFDDMVWSTMRSVVYQSPYDTAKYPNLACTAIRIKATDQINGAVDEISGVVGSMLNYYDGTSWTSGKTAADVQISSNPADIFRDIVTTPSNQQSLPVSRLLDSKLLEWRNECIDHLRDFNHVFDYRSSVLETLRKVASAGRAAPTTVDCLWSVVEDKRQTIPVQTFSARNTWGYRGTKAFVELPHAWKVPFVNKEVDWEMDEMIVYFPGYNANNATKFETLELTGITNENQLWQAAMFQMANVLYRPEQHEFDTDIEHIKCTRGDLILFNHDVPMLGLGSARIKGLTLNGSNDVTYIEIDDTLTVETGKSYSIRVRKADNSLSIYSFVNEGEGEYTNLKLATPISTGKPAVGDLVVFGETGSDSIELLVKSIIPRQNLEATIVCVEASYDEIEGVDKPRVNLAATDINTSTDVISAPSHHFEVDDGVLWYGDGTGLPTGIDITKTYYISATNFGADQFSISETVGGAVFDFTDQGTESFYSLFYKIPEHVPQVTGAVTQSTPQIIDIVSDESVLKIQPTGELVTRIRINFATEDSLIITGTILRYRRKPVTTMPDNSGWKTVDVTSDTLYLEGVEQGATYEITAAYKVKTSNVLLYSSPVEHTVVGKSTPPNAPTGLTATAKQLAAELSWTNDSVLDLSYVRIYRGTVNDINDAGTSIVHTQTSAPGSVASFTDPIGIKTYYYWIRSVDTSGNEGVETASVVVTGSTSGHIVVDLYGTGDFTSLTDAIDALPANGGNIFVKDGVYIIPDTNPTVGGYDFPDKNIEIVGESKQGVIINTNEGSCWFTLTDILSNITFRNVHFYSDHTADFGICLYLVSTSPSGSWTGSLTVDTCKFTMKGSSGSGDRAVQKLGTANRIEGSVRVINNEVSGGENFVYLDGVDTVRITGNTSRDVTLMPVYLYGCKNHFIASNDIYGPSSYGIRVIGYGVTAKGTVDGNIVDIGGFYRFSLYVYGVVGGGGVINNTVTATDTTATSKATQPFQAAHCDGVPVTGNTVRLTLNEALPVYGIFLPFCNDLTVTGNTVYVDNSDITTDNYGIYVGYVSNSCTVGPNNINMVNNTAKDVGIYVSTGSAANHLIGNTTNNAGVPIDDKGDNTTITAPKDVGADTHDITAGEAIFDGAFVHIADNSGVGELWLADANNGRPADGFVLAATALGNKATVYYAGSNNHLSGLTPGKVWLSTTPGMSTNSPDYSSGNIIQELGTASSATNIDFKLLDYATMA